MRLKYKCPKENEEFSVMVQQLFEPPYMIKCVWKFLYPLIIINPL